MRCGSVCSWSPGVRQPQCGSSRDGARWAAVQAGVFLTQMGSVSGLRCRHRLLCAQALWLHCVLEQLLDLGSYGRTCACQAVLSELRGCRQALGSAAGYAGCRPWLLGSCSLGPRAGEAVHKQGTPLGCVSRQTAWQSQSSEGKIRGKLA